MSNLHELLKLADLAFDDFEFGEGVSVQAQGAWDTSDRDDLTKIIYVSYAEDPSDADTHKIAFHVSFTADDCVGEVYALDVDSGNSIGCSGPLEPSSSGTDSSDVA